MKMKKNLIDYELLWEKITDYAKATGRTMYLANLHTSFLCNLIYPTFSRILLYSC